MSKEAISTERALKLALEALGWTDEWRPDGLKEQAITALREALAQDVPETNFRNTALDKMAENARELGLDYEPAQETDQSVMYTYPSKPEPIPCGKPIGILMKRKGYEHMKLYPLAEQSAQPTVPQDIPDLIAGALGVSRGTAYDMMREALAEQPAPVAKPHEQEPVATLWQHGRTGRTRITMPGDITDCDADWFKAADLYTSPPAQRTWVGLTDEEVIAMSRYDLEYAALIGEVQRRLKEKNT